MFIFCIIVFSFFVAHNVTTACGKNGNKEDSRSPLVNKSLEIKNDLKIVNVYQDIIEENLKTLEEQRAILNWQLEKKANAILFKNEKEPKVQVLTQLLFWKENQIKMVKEKMEKALEIQDEQFLQNLARECQNLLKEPYIFEAERLGDIKQELLEKMTHPSYLKILKHKKLLEEQHAHWVEVVTQEYERYAEQEGKLCQKLLKMELEIRTLIKNHQDLWETTTFEKKKDHKIIEGLKRQLTECQEKSKYIHEGWQSFLENFKDSMDTLCGSGVFQKVIENLKKTP